MAWHKTGKEIRANAEKVITYTWAFSSMEIKSVTKQIPHSNGRSGTWTHTTYFVVWNNMILKEMYSLKDAKEYAEKVYEEEYKDAET